MSQDWPTIREAIPFRRPHSCSICHEVFGHAYDLYMCEICGEDVCEADAIYQPERNDNQGGWVCLVCEGKDA